MIPPVVASTAINAIGQVGSDVLTQWKHLISAGRTAGSNGVSSASDSFGTLLSAHGVNGTSKATGPGVTGA